MSDNGTGGGSRTRQRWAGLVGAVGVMAGTALLMPGAAHAADLEMHFDRAVAVDGETVTLSGSGCLPAEGGEVVLSYTEGDMVHAPVRLTADEDGSWSVSRQMSDLPLTARASCVDYLGTREYPSASIDDGFVPTMTVDRDAALVGETLRITGTCRGYPLTPEIQVTVTGAAPVTLHTVDGRWTHQTPVTTSPDGYVQIDADCGGVDYPTIRIPLLPAPTVTVDRTTIRSGEKFTVSGTGCSIASAGGLIMPKAQTVGVSIDGVPVAPAGLVPRSDASWSFVTSVTKAAGSTVRVESWCAVGATPITVRSETTVAFEAVGGSGGSGQKLSATGFDSADMVIGGALIVLAGAGLTLVARRRDGVVEA